MTLNPQNRVLLQDSLQPPPGWRTDLAIGTTYTLDLVSLLAASLSFAAYDAAEVEGEQSDPVQLMEAVQRHADKTLIFCQAGGIYVPAKYRSVLTFIENSIHEVVAPTTEGIFHPKIWALRFSDDAGALRHRLIVLSRNITQDQAWDTALVLDEAPDTVTEDGPALDAAPAADFLTALPQLATRELHTERIRQVQDLASTLRHVQLMLPAPFKKGHLLPIGFDGGSTWPFYAMKAKRILAISPFLSKKAIRALGKAAPGAASNQRLLLSSPVSLDMLAAEATEGWQLRVLPTSPTGEGEADESESAGPHQALETSQGLHAKTVVVDLPNRWSSVVTGSANLTGSPEWGRSIEFNAQLFGRTSDCGVDAMLGTAAGRPGLEDVWIPYESTGDENEAQHLYEAERAIEKWHMQLADGQPTLEIRATEEATVEATLTLDVPEGEVGASTIWPISLPHQGRSLTPCVHWPRLSALNITPFLAVETTLGSGEHRVTRRRVLIAELTGDIEGRQQAAFRDVIKDKSDVLRYLMLLLSDASYEALLAQMDTLDVSSATFSVRDQDRFFENYALFEPLVRAVGRDPDTLVRIRNLMEQLRAAPDAEDLVPAGLDELWTTIWQVHEEAS